MQERHKKFIFMAYIPDRYLLPVCVCDTEREMANACGKTLSAIQSAVEKNTTLKNGPMKGCKICKINMEE